MFRCVSKNSENREISVSVGILDDTDITPCLAGPQPQGSGPSPGPLLAVFIHTVECKIDGPLNY